MSNGEHPPIRFAPIYMERIWGGRELERVYHRSLPTPNRPYGESWELVDREDAQSVVLGGPYAEATLHELWTGHRAAIFGEGYESHCSRFPILLKILDARDDLSIQVHPPVSLAASLGGEPKTEMWVIAECDPGAKLHVGFNRRITCEEFRRALATDSVADCVHTITPRPGDSIFIPSGRLHAIGAGFLIHEIQQNSDTTYRVYDWNRLGLDGKPRELHIEKSMASIDFNDVEPMMDKPDGSTLARCPYFQTDRHFMKTGDRFVPRDAGRFSILSLMVGSLRSEDGACFSKGDTVLLPKGASPLVATAATTLLEITLPG